MATIFGYCPDTLEGFYGSWVNADAVLNAAGFAVNGDTTDHGFAVYARPPGNHADVTVMGILDRSINRILSGENKQGWTAADAAAWAAAHPGVITYAVWQV